MNWSILEKVYISSMSCHFWQGSQYFLLTEFKGCTVSYGVLCFNFNLWPGCKEPELWIEVEKTRWHNLHYLDWENKFGIMFMISLGNWIELESTLQSQAVHTLEYSTKSTNIAHLVPEREIMNSALLWKDPCQQDWEQL